MIELTHLKISYGPIEVVPNLSLKIKEGEFFTLLGPSGCGKTTLLRAIAGFVPVVSGQILIDGQDVTRIPAENRNVGFVFQNYALFPHMTVAENVAFGLKVARRPREEIRASVERMLDATGILAYRDKKPETLSGGQQQRVAIARSLVMGTQVLLFDEPLSNLDAKIRENMRHEIKQLQRELGFTAVYVTHDQEEALSLSDRLLVFNNGHADQIGTAQELYNSPATPFVCQFIGAANELGEKTRNQLGLPTSGRIFLRPEHILIAAEKRTAKIQAHIRDVDYLGLTTRLLVEFDGEPLTITTLSHTLPAKLSIGDEIGLFMDPNVVIVFDEEM